MEVVPPGFTVVIDLLAGLSCVDVLTAESVTGDLVDFAFFAERVL